MASVHGREPYKAAIRTWPRAVPSPPKPYMAAKAVHGRHPYMAASHTFGLRSAVRPVCTRPRSHVPDLASPDQPMVRLTSLRNPLPLSPARCAPGGTLRRPKQITVITVTDHRPIKRMPRYRSVCTAARCIGPVAPSSSSPPWTSTRRTCTGCIDDRDGITNAAHTTRHAAPVRATSRRTADAAAGRAASRAPGSRRGEHTHAPRIGVSTTSATQL